MLKLLPTIALVFLIIFIGKTQTTIVLNPAKDNTIFEESGDESLGASGFIFSGKTGNMNGQNVRRALLNFDLTQIPNNATIQSVELELAIFKAPNSNTHNMKLHRVMSDWGEGNSGAGISGGAGVQAATNDATWSHRFYNTSQTWSQMGGDFVNMASATAGVQFVNSPSIPKAQWSSAGLVTDVQEWIEGTNSNFGWILIGDESTTLTAKKFVGGDNTSILFPKPKLTITYTTPGGQPSTSLLINETNVIHNWVEIYNPTDQVIDMSSWSLCAGTTCNTIGSASASIIHGNSIIGTGAFTVIRWDPLNDISGEIILQSSVGALDISKMEDYLQYGSANQMNAANAVTENVWDDAALFLVVPSDTSESMSLMPNSTFTSGEDTESLDWTSWGETPTLLNAELSSTILLDANIVGATYTASGTITVAGTTTASSVVVLKSATDIILAPEAQVDSSGVLEALIDPSP